MTTTKNWEWIDPKTLKTDGDNPNVMTKTEKEALKKNIERFGWNMPIIVDQDNIVADGEQKLEVALDSNWTEVPILKKTLTVTERKLIRQSMNKLRGSHDEERDVAEFKRILENSELQELVELTSISEQEILNMIERQEKDTIDAIQANQVDQLGKHVIECPKCHHKFEKKDSK